MRRRMRSRGLTVEDVRRARKGWFLVSAEGASWLISGKLLGSMGIEKGSEVCGDEMNEAAMRDQLPAARADAQRYVSPAERTVSQLESYLRRRLYSEAAIGEVLQWAGRNGLVDDARYARLFMESHSRSSPMGDFRIRMELRNRGVPDGIIENTLRDREENELFEMLVDDIRTRYGGLDHTRAFRRASAYLQRRGFGYDLAVNVLKKALGGHDGRPD